MHREKSMVKKKIKELSFETIKKKPYTLLIIDASEIDEVHKWFHANMSKYSFEKVFIAEMKASMPLQKPIGFIALIKFKSMEQMKTVLLNINKEVQEYKDWKCDFMKADWIELKGLERVTEKMVRIVGQEGRISFKNHRYFVSQLLQGEKVDLKVNNGILEIYFQGALVKTQHLLQLKTNKLKEEL